jgi:mono/diheme cytochrome c family protein
MRHLLANILTYTIAVMIFVGAALFARMRSSQYTLTYQHTVLAAYEPAPVAEFRWREIGAETYRRNCRSCHGADGGGWDQYPPVHDAADMVRTSDGRQRLIDIQLLGLSRKGSRVPMPAMGHLHDVEIASVLNYIATAFDPAGIAEPYTPAEIRDRRGLPAGAR